LAAVAHVAITVPDLEEAIAWYGAALGLTLLPERVEASVAGGERMRSALTEVYDERCEEVRVAFLTDGQAVAIELFEFDGGRGWTQPERWPYERAGISHLGLLVDDLDAVAERIVANGGTRRSRTMTSGVDGERRFLFCYCDDPYGTVIELQNASHEEMYGERSR
jgi:catechol 2,3-dioxygenase-like lactoylglutathione lyase family enzyme